MEVEARALGAGAPFVADNSGSQSDSPATARSSSSLGGPNLADLQDSEVATCAILLPSKYTAKEGAALWGGVKLGRLLGAGVQAKVYELEHADGRPTGKVLKLSHTDFGHRLLNNPVIWIGMEREWEIGTQLRAALEEPGGTLPGFMRVCDCLVRTDDPATGKAQFNGMILEKLNGWEVYKRIDTEGFHNIAYVREMLFQVFSALDRAQRKLGFYHADLGMRNIMEHYPRLWDSESSSPAAAHAGAVGPRDCLTCHQHPPPPPQQPQQQQQLQQQPRLPAGVVPGSGQVIPPQVAGSVGQQAGEDEQPLQPLERQASGVSTGQPWWRTNTSGQGGVCGRVRPRPGFSCNADGSRLPMGPNVEFKIIDYGLAIFDERLAQAAGGYESEGVMSRLNHVFAARQITFSNQGSQSQKRGGGTIEMQTSEAVLPGRKQKTWHLVPTGIKNRFRVKQTPAGARPVASADSLAADGMLPPVAELHAAHMTQQQQPGQAQQQRPGQAQRQPVAAAPAGPAAAAGEQDEVAGGGDDVHALPQRYKSATLLRRPGEGLERAGELMRASQGEGANPVRSPGGTGSSDGGSVQYNPQRVSSHPVSYKQSPIEKMYRRFWRRKGDVFHLLVNMALVLDDRVWPKEDERDVQLFITLVHHVTGVRMKASFAAEGDKRSTGLFGRLACVGASRVKEEGVAHGPVAHGPGHNLREFGRWGKWSHWFRRMHMRFQAHAKPYNSGLLAGEALVAPFFGAGRVQHAKLPVCVETAFPRSSS